MMPDGTGGMESPGLLAKPAHQTAHFFLTSSSSSHGRRIFSNKSLTTATTHHLSTDIYTARSGNNQRQVNGDLREAVEYQEWYRHRNMAKYGNKLL